MCFLSFVWRQLELAFFGAVTPVAALFISERRRICSMEFMGTKEAAEKLNVKLKQDVEAVTRSRHKV